MQAPGVTRLLPVSIIVAAQTLHAVGIAYAMKLRGESAAVVTFLGDGGTSEGDFHEALNFASVWQVPVVFICQNNQWAISMPRGRQTRSRTIAQKAIAYDLPGVQVDGNDVLAMYASVKEALDRARAGGGPTLIEARSRPGGSAIRSPASASTSKRRGCGTTTGRRCSRRRSGRRSTPR